MDEEQNLEYLYICSNTYLGDDECFLDVKVSSTAHHVFTSYSEMCKFMFRRINFIEQQGLNNIVLWMQVYSANNPGVLLYTYYYAYLNKTKVGEKFYLTDKRSMITLNLPYTDARNVMRYRLEEISHFIPNKNYERMYKKAKLEVKFEKGE